ncbi:MAG: hypothetical protein EOP24_42770, partial [Hyphomicrobiales bacterium]
PAEGYTTAFQMVGIAAVVGALLITLTVDPERDRARIAALDPLTHADGSVDDAVLVSGEIDDTNWPDRTT